MSIMCSMTSRRNSILSTDLLATSRHLISTTSSCPSPLLVNIKLSLLNPGLKIQTCLAPCQTSDNLQSRVQPTPAQGVSLHNSILRCQFCEKGGFPTKKALKYHLFRLHGQPMRKASQQKTTSSSQEHPETSPIESVHPTSTVQRQDARLSISFPIHGK
ncbi:hypothetical protein CDAR_567201 [Caerostris darwini]|uniref:C2H2-type domain-containing protein n=1 Tax=Caerostris darwini TaxID=1538125 RepID=A0AAV4QZ17_9ARAC|nr:hypothetical protein CDAR_567201 [Caerostris darwini]